MVEAVKHHRPIGEIYLAFVAAGWRRKAIEAWFGCSRNAISMSIAAYQRRERDGATVREIGAKCRNCSLRGHYAKRCTFFGVTTRSQRDRG